MVNIIETNDEREVLWSTFLPCKRKVKHATKECRELGRFAKNGKQKKHGFTVKK